MKEITYFVRTTNERNFNYDLDYKLLVDKDHKPVKSFINQLKYISQYDSVLLEDDLVLCNNFKDKIEKVINDNPDVIINFFYDPAKYYLTRLSTKFAYNQCTYYPKGIALKIAELIEQLHASEPNLQYDVLENLALEMLELSHLQYRPCLVQHMDKNSLIQQNHIKYSRMTIYFDDYLEELGIEYDKAYTFTNQLKLYKKLKEHIKESMNK